MGDLSLATTKPGFPIEDASLGSIPPHVPFGKHFVPAGRLIRSTYR